MVLLRAFAVWLIIVVVETIHGTLRTLFLAPYVGDLRARQMNVFTGSLLIFGIALLFIRWIGAASGVSLLAIGLFWLVLTLLFEITLGRLIFRLSWERIFADYDISRGGLLLFGMLFVTVTPLVAARIRHIETNWL